MPPVGYQFRKELTIDSSLIDSNLSNFPILVKLDSSNFDFAKARSDGFDIIFTDSDGETLLDFERESYDSINEIAFFWVKIPSISSSINTSFYIYYHNSSASDTSSPSDVWDSNFVMVHHLKDDTTSTILDSTINNNDGTKQSANNPLQIDSNIGKGQQYDGDSTDKITVAANNSFNLTTNQTYHIRFRIDGTTGAITQTLISRWQSPFPFKFDVVSDSASLAKIAWNGNYRGTGFSNTTLMNGQYHQLDIVCDSTQTKIYVDDVLVETITGTISPSGNVPMGIGFEHGPSATWFLRGVIDEIRLSNIVRNDAWRKAEFNSETHNLLTFGNEQPEVSTTENIQVSDILDVEETSFQATENIQISDTLEVTETTPTFDENIEVSDVLNVQETTKDFSENIQISDILQVDEVSTNTEAHFATRIIHVNPLVFVTNTNPAEIVKVDISDPENPIHEVKTLIGASFATDVIYNENTGFVYVACANGIIVKVELADLNNQTIIDLSDTDEVIDISVLGNFGITYAGTNQSTGEVYLIDEREVTTLNTDFHFLSENTIILESDFHLIEAELINTDFHFLSQQTVILQTEFYFLPTVDPDPIKRSDYHIYLDNVEVSDNDVILSSVRINHQIDTELSTAIMTFTRNHDRLNYDQDGNLRPITNQNQLRIERNGIIEFDGKIATIDANYAISNDQVSITANSVNKTPNYQQIDVPIASVDEPLNLYHVLINNPTIDNTPVTATEPNPAYFKGIRVNLGDITKQSVLRFSSFQNGTSLAEDLIDGLFNAKQNWTYFWFVRAGLIRPEITVQSQTGNTTGNGLVNGFLPEINFPTIEFPTFNFTEFAPQFSDFLTTQAIQRYIGTSLSGLSSDLWDLLSASYKYQRIEDDIIEPGIILDEFKSEGESSFELTDTPTNGFHSIELVTINGKPKEKDEYTFSGNSVTIISGTSVGDRVQIQYGVNDYFVGEAPFDTISVRNGKLISKERWVDNEDGFYREKDDSYDFIEYAKEVANLEYEKLQNINGQVAPRTSCNLTLTHDAYYYYNISLLTRININNTIQNNEYRNNNGFPVSVKSITIDLGTMQVSLQCDNSKSNVELEEIDGRFPDEESEDYNFEGYSIKQHSKFDLASKETVE